MSGTGRGCGMVRAWLGNIKPVKLSHAGEVPDLVEDDNLLLTGADNTNGIVFDEPSHCRSTVEILSDKIVRSLSASYIPEDEVGPRRVQDPCSIAQREEKSPRTAAHFDLASTKMLECAAEVYSAMPSICQNRQDVAEPICPSESVDVALANISITAPTTADERLVKAVNAPEFKPGGSAFISSEDLSVVHFGDSDLEIGDSDVMAVEMFKQEIDVLADDPELFYSIADLLAENLPSLITKEETLEELVNYIMAKALSESNFRYSAAKLAQRLHETKFLEFQESVSFRKCFFHRCRVEFLSMRSLVQSAEASDKVASVAYFFGELLCNMKLRGEINPVFQNAVIEIVELFIKHATTELIVCLARLLKLVGPAMDLGCSEPAKKMFEAVREFCFSGVDASRVSGSAMQSLLSVYKQHTRGWDRPASVHEPAARKSSGGSSGGRSDSSDGPVDWEEYYGGDDEEISPELLYHGEEVYWGGAENDGVFSETFPPSTLDYDVDDEEVEEAFLAFLRESNQLP